MGRFIVYSKYSSAVDDSGNKSYAATESFPAESVCCVTVFSLLVYLLLSAHQPS